MAKKKMKLMLIIGGGKFGKKAIDYARANSYRLILVDKDPNCPCSSQVARSVKDPKLLVSQVMDSPPKEGIFLNHDLSRLHELILSLQPDIIIPVVPIHVLSSILVGFLGSHEVFLAPDPNAADEFSENADQDLILHVGKDQGVAYLSYAKSDETCPDSCPGPLDYCPHFHREKPITMTGYVRKYFNRSGSINIKRDEWLKMEFLLDSQQLAPGLGGLSGEDVLEMLNFLDEHLQEIRDHSIKLIVGTTCNCHGVLNFYEKEK